MEKGEKSGKKKRENNVIKGDINGKKKEIIVGKK